MLIAHDYRASRRGAPAAVAIGNFDGVHRGHRALFARVLEAARASGGEALALTFDPHPTRVLAPSRAAPLLTGLDRKLELMAEAGLDATVVQRFDASFATQSPREFAREVLGGMGVRAVFVGADFRFGKGRAGDGAVLAELGKELGFSAEVVPAVEEAGEAISSSRLRRALADGDLPRVAVMLGRRFDLEGLVVQGEHRGRTLGFPTANLATQVEALPRDGVYAVRARVLRANEAGGSAPAWFDGVMNLGVRPTFAAGRSLEVHLLDAGDPELYGRTLRVECVARLRDERKFPGVDALREQLARDVRDARAALATESGR